MTPLEVAQARYVYARETHRLALELWDYIFPPWRWPEWNRRAREVRRRSAALRGTKGVPT